MSKPKSSTPLARIRKKTCIGSSVRSRLTRRGHTRKRYRGQGK